MRTLTVSFGFRRYDEGCIIVQRTRGYPSTRVSGKIWALWYPFIVSDTQVPGGSKRTGYRYIQAYAARSS